MISIGNLSVGGTGKTPMVEWTARRLLAGGHRVAIISRGYGASRPGHDNDETSLLRANLPGVPHYIDADRVAAAGRAAADGVDVVVLDDGFQHRRIARDLDIVLLDATLPPGGYRPLPLGSLRDPFSSLRRAQLAVLTRVDQARRADLEWLRSRVRRAAPGIDILESTHAPVGFHELGGKQEPAIDGVASLRACLFSAIGNPAAFEAVVEELGVTAVMKRRFVDHHRFDVGDVAALVGESRSAGIDVLITTQKDAVKIDPAWLDGMRVLVLRIEMAFPGGSESLERHIAAAAGAPSAAGDGDW